jgi:N-acetylmuramoyl-L-alanine amidase
MIEADGKIHNIHPVDKPSNGVAGHNARSIHIAYIGGIDKAGKPLDTRTPRQIVSLLALIAEFRELYPAAEVLGHRDFPKVAKACPSFDVRQWLSGTNIINAEKTT